MCNVLKAFWGIVVIFLTLSCAVSPVTSRPISHFTQIDSLSVASGYDKICYVPQDRTFFCLSRDTNTITIYKNGVFFNTIGGAGFRADSFRNLSDISVGAEGILYALDSSTRLIKMFDKDGVYINQVNLDRAQSPILLAFSLFGNVYVYDSHIKEILIYNLLDFSQVFSFGRFQINSATQMYASGNFLHIYDGQAHQTHIYNINGMFVKSVPGFALYDSSEIMLGLDELSKWNANTESRPETISVFGRYDIERDFIVHENGGEVNVFRIVYK
jgi:hypothetical protein